MTISIQLAVQIARPVEVVCAFVTDLERLPLWISVKEVRNLSGGPLRAGTDFEMVQEILGQDRTFKYRVTVYQPCQRFAYESNGKNAAKLDVRMTPAQGGTRLSVAFQLEVNRWIAPVIRGPIRDQMAQNLARLAAALEENHDQAEQ